jgi:hypothetical protein
MQMNPQSMMNKQMQINNNPFTSQNMIMQMNMERNQMTPNNDPILLQQNTSHMNQINSQMTQINPFGEQRNPDSEIINDVQNILKTDSEEKTELLGETIFYYLLRFIAKYNLNNSEGKFDDPALCSKLTGMFLSIEVKDLLEILSNSQYLVFTIKDVLKVILF